MKPGPLALAVAAVLRLDHKSVEVTARALREAGLLTTGARGRNAPDMTPKDLAVHLIAALATDKPARAVALVTRLGGFRLSAPAMADAVASALPDPLHTFLEFMTAVCSPAVDLSGRDLAIRAVGAAMVMVESRDLPALCYAPVDELDELAGRLSDGGLSDVGALPPDLAAELFDGLSSLHGLVVSREVRGEDVDLIKRVAFGGAEC